MLTRYFSPQRKTWLTSLCVGIIVALLAGSIQFMVIYHNRAERFDAIINNVNTYLKSYFHDLRQTINGLQPLVDQPCENIDSGLTSHAAFSPNVRAFLLVKNGVAFCSSATGAMDTPCQHKALLSSQHNSHASCTLSLHFAQHRTAILCW